MFSDLLNETKWFKYQVTVKFLLEKYKLNGEIEFVPGYFNSKTKTGINHKFKLENSFQEIDWCLMFGLIMDLDEMLNQLSLTTLIFQLIDHYQEVFIWTYLLN